MARIALGLALLIDLARRIPGVTLWYSNEGLLPNHTVLWRPPFPYAFSLLFTASSPFEAGIGFCLCAAAYLMLLLGYRTRLSHVASLIALLSLHGRILFVQSGGDVILVELCVWTLFLPTGRRYSIDATIASSPIGPTSTGDTSPVVSLAAVAPVAQLAVIYAFNAVQKSGPTWRHDGSAIHFVLYSEGLVTRLGLWIRGWLTPAQSKGLTWSVLAIESLLPILLLTPIGQRPARRLAIALILALHLGIAACLNLGIFVVAMLAYVPLLVSPSDWDSMERWWRRVRRRWARSSVGFTRLGGVIARLRALAIRQGADLDRLPLESAGVVGGRFRTAARELSVAVLMLFAAIRVATENPAVTGLNPTQTPRIVDATTTYLQMLQAWLLFAPDAPLTDATVSVDAVTADGRHVDPLNEEMSPSHRWIGETIPPRLGHDALASGYLLRIPYYPDYFPALQEWLLRYPERTGRVEDRIQSFEVFFVERDNPPLGERQPRQSRRRLLFKYPE